MEVLLYQMGILVSFFIGYLFGNKQYIKKILK